MWALLNFPSESTYKHAQEARLLPFGLAIPRQVDNDLVHCAGFNCIRRSVGACCDRNTEPCFRLRGTVLLDSLQHALLLSFAPSEAFCLLPTLVPALNDGVHMPACERICGYGRSLL
jgi:hypothetical protein